jgi:hypothetical protein
MSVESRTMESNAKENKDFIGQLICNSFCYGSPRQIDEDKEALLFWIEEDGRCPQFQTKFCTKCGNYICYNVRQPIHKIECNC